MKYLFQVPTRCPSLSSSAPLVVSPYFVFHLINSSLCVGNCGGGGASLEDFGEGPCCNGCHVMIANEWLTVADKMEWKERDWLWKTESSTKKYHLSFLYSLDSERFLMFFFFLGAQLSFRVPSGSYQGNGGNGSCNSRLRRALCRFALFDLKQMHTNSDSC